MIYSISLSRFGNENYYRLEKIKIIAFYESVNRVLQSDITIKKECTSLNDKGTAPLSVNEKRRLLYTNTHYLPKEACSRPTMTNDGIEGVISFPKFQRL